MPIIIRKRGAFTGSFAGRREFIAKVRECQELARQQFPEFTLSDEYLPIVFVAKGRSVGVARFATNAFGQRVYNIEFSVDAIQKEWNDMIGDTIPHEMAHIVDCFVHGRPQQPHGPRWKSIARRLGCTGKRTHNYNVEKARKTKQFQYEATCGSKVFLGTGRHNKIQRGYTYKVSRTGGQIKKDGFTGKVVVN